MEQELYSHPAIYDSLYRQKDYAGEVDFVLTHTNLLDTENPSALIVGCGTGTHAKHLADHGVSVTGVDPHPAMLERARTKSTADFRKDSLPDLDIDVTADLVWAPFTVLNYLDADTIEPALTALTDRVAPDGTLVVDLGDFQPTPAPQLQVATAPVECARLYQWVNARPNRIRMDALIFLHDTWLFDQHTLTPINPETVTDHLTTHGFTSTSHEWYGTPTVMDDPCVVIATHQS